MLVCAQRQSAARTKVCLQARVDGAIDLLCQGFVRARSTVILAGDYNVVPTKRIGLLGFLAGELSEEIPKLLRDLLPLRRAGVLTVRSDGISQSDWVSGRAVRE